MTTILCDQDDRLRELIVRFAETLKTEAHQLGDHGLSERDFYQGGLFRGAIERVRGQFSASMRDKREFVKHILNFLEDGRFIRGWEAAGDANRHDYMVTLNDGRLSAIELKGCLDGNNTNIFERPPQAQEFVLWSVCSNAGASPRHNVWSGIHTRLSAEIISRAQQVDGLVVWDWLCGTVARPCPKLASGRSTLTTVGPFALPPPCIYLFPRTIPHPRTNPRPVPHAIGDVGILDALHRAFAGEDAHLSFVEFSVAYAGTETVRETSITRGGVVVAATQRPTPILRT